MKADADDPATEANEALAERAESLQMPTLAAYRDALESVRLEIEDSSETLTVWTRVQNAVSSNCWVDPGATVRGSGMRLARSHSCWSWRRVCLRYCD